ncbi:DegT/DnrJ/EryC1/StrS family aminotransferase [Winogradskyella aurantiaca]|uniref:DegT/DnrJ/EryC1/StrS family aminotransferase n=1 Tax=Winogradskyella aurantiaca TaxID=2219558 RepID=UPI000E1D7756|nr:DegT/DnrJ/EryC1/StrS family aminotransferase [Winogradskyella aurantiaca]
MAFKIWLSPPHIGTDEVSYIEMALKANHLAYFGENTIEFNSSLRAYSQTKYAVLTNSGTSAIHLALKVLGVESGDHVICQSNSFVASANPILYLNAIPVFIDSEKDTWNMSPDLLDEALNTLKKKGIKPKAIISVDLYGMPCEYDGIRKIANNHEVPILEDSAEALGSSYKGIPCGNLGSIGVYSFNANKIITTSGGGALVTNSKDYCVRADYLANQAKADKAYLWHEELGYNYKFSNVLAGIGVAQLNRLDEYTRRRRHIFNVYQKKLCDLNPEVSFQKESSDSYSNRWLSCFTFTSFEQKESVKQALLNANIECRSLWFPLHKQPVFRQALSFNNGVSEDLFEKGLCLPSGSNLQANQLEEIISVISEQIK